MLTVDDSKPFSIQAETRLRTRYPRTTIPWWLAKLAHVEYRRRGHYQSLERINERGGFGRSELVALLRGDYTRKGIMQAEDDLENTMTGDQT